MDGLTGKVKFDQFGLRTDFQLEIVELKKKGLQKVNECINLHISTSRFFVRLEPGMISLESTFPETLQKVFLRWWRVLKTKLWSSQQSW